MAEAGVVEIAGSTAEIGDVERPRWRWDAAATVVTLAAALIVLILGIFAFLCWQAFGTTIAQAQARAQTAADIVADDVEWAFAAARSDLNFIAAEPDATAPSERAGYEAALAALPTGTELGFFDAQGHALAGNPAGLPADIADDDLFHALQGGADGAIARQTTEAVSGPPL